MEVQRGAGTWVRPRSWEVVELGLKLSVLDQGLLLFSNTFRFSPNDSQLCVRLIIHFRNHKLFFSMPTLCLELYHWNEAVISGKDTAVALKSSGLVEGNIDPSPSFTYSSIPIPLPIPSFHLEPDTAFQALSLVWWAHTDE